MTYKLLSESRVFSIMSLYLTGTIIEHCVGDEDEDAHRRSERPRAGPLGGGNALRNERVDGRQAYAETDDDEDY